MSNVEAQKDTAVSIAQLVYQTAFESNDQFRELAEKQAAEKRQKEAESAQASASPSVVVDVKATTADAAPDQPPPPQAVKLVDITA